MDNNNFDVIKNEVVEQDLKDTLDRGVAFEGMIRSQGWIFVKAYIENNIQAFSNKAIKSGFKDIEEYNLERGKIVGLTNLLAAINNDLTILDNARKTKGITQQ